jgi:hypothetical protein
MLASSGALDPILRQEENKGSKVAVQSFNSNAPSKEYIYAGGRLLAIEEPCSYSISPADAFYSTAGSEGIVTLTTGAGCVWTAISSNPDWLTITSNESGSGSEQISYVVRDNLSGVPRQGTITIGGRIFTVTQAGLDPGECTYVLSPTFQNFNASGGTGSISVFTEERCAWQAVSNANWVTITSGCCSIDDGQVNYSVAQNTTGSARNGTITVSGQSFTVKQKKP